MFIQAMRNLRLTTPLSSLTLGFFTCCGLLEAATPGQLQTELTPPTSVGAEPSAHPASSTIESLGQNYLIRLEGFRSGTNCLDLRLVTASRNFQLSLGSTNVQFGGVLSPPRNGQMLLEYSLAATIADRDVERRGSKSQANNQMVNSGLLSFIYRSSLSYAPQQNEATLASQKGDPAHRLLYKAAVLVPLGKPVTILAFDHETYRIRVEPYRERGGETDPK